MSMGRAHLLTGSLGVKDSTGRLALVSEALQTSGGTIPVWVVAALGSNSPIPPSIQEQIC